MILKSISLFRARKNPERAQRIAGELATDTALLPAQAILGKIKLIYAGVGLIALLLTGGAIWLGVTVHGAFHILTFIGIGVLLILFALFRGSMRALEAAQDKAGQTIGAAARRVRGDRQNSPNEKDA